MLVPRIERTHGYWSLAWLQVGIANCVADGAQCDHGSETRPLQPRRACAAAEVARAAHCGGRGEVSLNEYAMSLTSGDTETLLLVIPSAR